LGDAFYLPNVWAPVLEVGVNIHVMQFVADNSQNFEDNSIDRTTIQRKVNYCNSEVYARSGTLEKCNNTETTAPAMVDSRIRIILNDLFFHVDPTGWSNDGSSVNFYCRDNYVAPNPDIQDQINIVIH